MRGADRRTADRDRDRAGALSKSVRDHSRGANPTVSVQSSNPDRLAGGKKGSFSRFSA
jgi:hypothetical protein